MWWYWRECDIGENVMILARMWWIRLVFWTKIATVGDILGVAQWNFEKLGIKNINKIKKYHFLKNRYFSLLFFDFPFWRNPNFGNFYWFSIDFLLENQVPITKNLEICIGKSRLGGFLRDSIEKVLFPIKVIHIGAGLSAFRILPKHLVKEHAVCPQLEWASGWDIDQYHPPLSTFALKILINITHIGNNVNLLCTLSECTISRFNLVKQRGLGFFIYL